MSLITFDAIQDGVVIFVHLSVCRSQNGLFEA
jgi:hypothetical protein